MIGLGGLDNIRRTGELVTGTDRLRMVLSLPRLELNAPASRTLPREWFDQNGMPRLVRDFLRRWERGEVSVLVQDRRPRHPRPEQC